jgi:hypothetical protein
MVAGYTAFATFLGFLPQISKWIGSFLEARRKSSGGATPAASSMFSFASFASAEKNKAETRRLAPKSLLADILSDACERELVVDADESYEPQVMPEPLGVLATCDWTPDYGLGNPTVPKSPVTFVPPPLHPMHRRAAVQVLQIQGVIDHAIDKITSPFPEKPNFDETDDFEPRGDETEDTKANAVPLSERDRHLRNLFYHMTGQYDRMYKGRLAGPTIWETHNWHEMDDAKCDTIDDWLVEARHDDRHGKRKHIPAWPPQHAPIVGEELDDYFDVTNGRRLIMETKNDLELRLLGANDDMLSPYFRVTDENLNLTHNLDETQSQGDTPGEVPANNSANNSVQAMPGTDPNAPLILSGPGGPAAHAHTHVPGTPGMPTGH